MRSLKILSAALALSAMPLGARAQRLENADQTIDRIVAQERAEVQLLRQYSPLVETYIQYLRLDKQAVAAPSGDKYFLGRAALAKGIELEPLRRDPGLKRKLLAGLRGFFSEFVPRGFLQMIYLDMDGFDRQHYNIEYRRREFLGEVRCLVFDVTPLANSGKGRFVGRIWVEDQDYHIVRFNGAYGGASLFSNYFNFDSWRTNARKNLWLPAFVYTEEGNLHDPKTQRIAFRPFRAQTRLWGYNLGYDQEEEELNKVLIESSTPITDSTESANDLSPVEAQRYWDRQAEDNVMDHLERQGLLAPRGDVEQVLENVVHNLELTNNLDIDPGVRCRILMTSTLESFTIGHTIVLSRGLVDVLPDEASLAALLAHELGHVLLAHRMDTEYGFFDTLKFDEKETFRHFDFSRTPEEEQAANQKGMELLANSPYKEQLGTARLFLQALETRSKEIPELISPHLGDRVPTGWAIASDPPSTESPSASPLESPLESKDKPAANTAAANTPATNKIVALPLGGRIRVNPWNDQLRMLKSKPAGYVAESEKMPFEITPFIFYLTRYNTSAEGKSPVAAQLPADPKP